MNIYDIANQVIVENPTSEKWVFNDQELEQFVQLITDNSTATCKWESETPEMVKIFDRFLTSTEDLYARTRYHDGLGYDEAEWEAFVWGWNSALGRVATEPQLTNS